jgi:integrase/recombinase XerC
VCPPKGIKKRIIPLNDSCRNAIKAWRSVHPTGKANRIYNTQRGSATTRAIQTVLENIGEAARVENMTPYVARHTFAKKLINAGVSLEKVAMLLGHSSLDTTMVYTTPG